MNDQPPLPSPWALWTVFDGFPQWFLARGYPPTLRDPRRWVRAMRVTVMLTILILLAAWSIAAIAMFIDDATEQSTLVVAGVPLGLFVLLPISRWLGRPWRLALLMISLAGLAMILQNEVATPWIDSIEPQRGATFGFVIAVGMLGVWPPRAWLLILLCTVCSMLVWPLSEPLGYELRDLADTFLPTSEQAELFSTSALATLIYGAVALPLGIWLWDPPRE